MKGLELDKYLRVASLIYWTLEHVCVFLLSPTNGMAHGTGSGNKSYIAVLGEIRET